MRKGFTLIELIFSMVIIAIAFTVLPKILQLSTKVSAQSLREEAMYSGIALLGFIKASSWDENNTVYDDILLAANGNSDYECSNGYRKGAFIGSRDCKHNLTASPVGSDSGEPPYDDMDDFVSIDAKNYNDSRDYSINVNINYVEDIGINEETFKTDIETGSTNTKYIVIDINSSKKEKQLRKNIARFSFFAFNIGQIQINRRAWSE